MEIIVSDTGSGIEPGIIEKIFEPYFTTKGPGEGTGMGLALVHGIVESYGGKIKVGSTLGRGTTFILHLPITKMASRILGQLGYSVTATTSSVEALELFKSKPNEFDLIVSDMTMPNMTGEQLAMECMIIRADIPVILCTGYSKKISENTSAEIGIKAFAYKPIVKADLAKTVRKVLDETKD